MSTTFECLILPVHARVFFLLASLTLVTLIGCSSSSSDSSQPVVSTTVSTHEGVVSGMLGDGVITFKGIPYAAPPLADLRWKSPQPVSPWQGTLNTTSFKPPCSQPEVSSSEGISGSPPEKATGSEDCLYLNVWAPANATSGSSLPVLVFSHGGADLFGSASDSIDFVLNTDSNANLYDGSRFAARGDAVVVTLNFRLGALGFLAHSGMLADSDTGSVGNYGIMDQIAALQWVQRNIAAFGGDPNRVMIFGQSAGGYNVCTLIASPLASGLFSRAMMESGSCSIHPAATAQKNAEAIVDEVGCTAASDLSACLRAVPAETFALADSSLPNGIGSFTMFPSVDGYVVENFPINIIKSGAHNPVPFIVGSNSEEYYVRFNNNVPDALYPDFISQLVGETNKDTVLAFYPLSDYASADDALADVNADRNIVCPAGRFATLVAANQTAPVYRYFFTRTLSTNLRLANGAYHSSELLYVFQHMSGLNFDANDADRVVETTVLDYWAHFAANGDPNGSTEPFWPTVSITDNTYQNIDVITFSGSDLKKAKCDMWLTLQ